MKTNTLLIKQSKNKLDLDIVRRCVRRELEKVCKLYLSIEIIVLFAFP